MKNFFAGIVAALLLVCLLAADGGYNVAWEYELKRPETQKALNYYIESHCAMYLYSNDIRRLRDDLKPGNVAGRQDQFHGVLRCQ